MSASPNSEIHLALNDQTPAPKPRPRMSTRNRLLFFATGWLIVLMPFLFWWNTWFGRQLSSKQIAEYLQDEKHPRHIQHALVQLGERMSHGDVTVKQWYPEAVRLANHPVEEVRNTDAWVMGQDTSGAGFHEALLKMLGDSSLTVRGNAALSLVRFGDASGRPQIIELLQPAEVDAPQAGTVIDTSTVGTPIHQGGMIAKLKASGQTVEVRSPISGRLRELSTPTGQTVKVGDKVATIDPSTEQVWEALRALYLIGLPEDIAAIRPYDRDLPDIPDRVRQQAQATEEAIRQRAAK
ncbi:MAG TPA: biotin/lipoyl-containing protein [Terriglobales bacterium]|jgi:biotin carboxyl carrier protein|nr:biotin/lipoyl-containing protein [Terriglobales bacterium]